METEVRVEMTDKQVKEIAEAVVEELFVNGQGGSIWP